MTVVVCDFHHNCTSIKLLSYKIIRKCLINRNKQQVSNVLGSEDDLFILAQTLL